MKITPLPKFSSMRFLSTSSQKMLSRYQIFWPEHWFGDLSLIWWKMVSLQARGILKCSFQILLMRNLIVFLKGIVAISFLLLIPILHGSIESNWTKRFLYFCLTSLKLFIPLKKTDSSLFEPKFVNSPFLNKPLRSYWTGKKENIKV